ncbi:hypothetical protein ACR8AL_07020 [Clavibacter sepedonicus]|uniref:hypothetical protein n=1 Tax=Clavibacter TaxID=1573 RepID=UPI00059B8C2B|nr:MULTISPECIES: hypothetical protein [Clavibacter]MBD5381748.1 hypothetical protein [Clavibacter sp.]OQJ48721.1 hypothetical protein B5P19_11000 [Clavibacter sepedonicus]OQJ54265.1 hypothetical protein B5P20_09185 [Clavibacter sepedonicus]UUK65812.1 hypothetical protein LRE50_00720 [Clavibacter sepedonicus]
MKQSTIVTALVCAVVLGVGLYEATQGPGDIARGVIVAAIAFAGPVTAMVVKGRRARSSRSDRPGSVEMALARDVQATVFRDVVIALPVAFLVSVVIPKLTSATTVFGILLILLVDFWLRYVLALRRAVRS